MKNACEKYELVLMAHLEGGLPVAVAAEWSAHLGACTACREAAAEMKGIADALGEAGDALHAELPLIDLSQQILMDVSALREGRKSLAPLGEGDAEVIAYLDGELDDFAAARMDRARHRDAALNEELTQLTELSRSLEALGVAHAAATPHVDLVAQVVALAKERALEDGALPELVTGLPEGVRMAMERFIEGEASSEEVDELRNFAVASPPLAELMDEYAALHAVLDEAAVAEERAVPRIELVAEVMAAVRKQQLRGKNIVPMQRPAHPGHANVPAQRRNALASLAVLAAAACLVLGLYIGRQLPGQQPGAANDLRAANTSAAQDAAKMAAVTPDAVAKENAQRMAEGEDAPNADGGQAEGADGTAGDAPQAGAEAPADETKLADNLPLGKGGRTLKDVLDERQKAFDNDQEALAKLMRWSTLSENEARKLMEDPKTDPAALLGAAEFLPPNEAASMLKAAVDKNPDDPYLRKALAKAYTENGDTELARQQLDAWSKMDPDNSMPKYLAAQMAFHEGDSASAIAALEEAAGYQHGSTYSTQSAQYRLSALGATGYNRDVASFLAGSTAGTGDYQYVTKLGNDLLDQGNQLRDSGQYDEAQRVYMGVYNLGSQVSNSAQLANDYASAYDVQNAALQALVTLSRLFSGVDQNNINQLLGDLQGGMAALTQLMNAYNSILGGTDINQIMQLIAATLSGGQLNFLQ